MRGRHQKPVIVHHCFNPEIHSGPKADCNCQKYVSIKTAEEMLTSGEARQIKMANGRSQLVATGRRPNCRIPRAATITALDMERAYVLGVSYHRKRIEEFATRLIIQPIVASVPEQLHNFS